MFNDDLPKKKKSKRCEPGDCVFARRPAGSLLTTARDVPYVWRLFRGVATAPAYSARRLRFSPTCRDVESGSGKGEGSSSVRSSAARIRDFEGPGSAIVAGGEKERAVRLRRNGVSN